MKKKILLTCLVALMSTTSAYSYTGECKGGTIVESTTGATFCMSNKGMNWWSAQAWCQVNGSQLATMYEMCPSWDSNTGDGKCPELNGKVGGYAWSATAAGSDYAFYVNLLYGAVNSYNSRSSREYSGNYAFCR